jgi:iron complex outermembrane receptor protein
VHFPTIGQRFGVSAVTRGNDALRVERAFSVELGGTWESAPSSWARYFLDASVFERHARDLIAYRRSALGYVRPFNVGSARFLGAEMSGEITAFEHLRQRATVTLLDPRDTTEGRTTTNDLLVYRSQITLSEELEVFVQKEASTITHAGLVAYFTYRSGRVADPAGLLIIPQQGIFDLGGRLQFVGQVDFRARLENVLNTARYDSLGFPLPGRSVFLSLELIAP